MSIKPHPTKGDGWWRLDIRPYGRNGPRKYPSFEGTYEEAKAYHDEYLATVGREPAVKSNQRLSEIAPRFYEYFADNVTPATMKDARSCFKKNIMPVFGSMQTIQITRSIIEKYKAARRSTEKPNGDFIKPKTINKELSYLNSLINYAVEVCDCRPLSFQMPFYPSKKTKAEPKHPLTERQVMKIYKHLDEEYRLIYLLMADAGLRIEEALKLKAEDINERAKIMRVLGKGEKYRIVPKVTERLWSLIIAALDERPEGYLTINKKTGKPYRDIKKALNRATEAAKIKRHVHHHLLRHTALTLMAEGGMSAHALQRIAGHASITTTNKIYTHVGVDFLKEESEKFLTNNPKAF